MKPNMLQTLVFDSYLGLFAFAKKGIQRYCKRTVHRVCIYGMLTRNLCTVEKTNNGAAKDAEVKNTEGKTLESGEKRKLMEEKDGIISDLEV